MAEKCFDQFGRNISDENFLDININEIEMRDLYQTLIADIRRQPVNNDPFAKYVNPKQFKTDPQTGLLVEGWKPGMPDRIELKDEGFGYTNIQKRLLDILGRDNEKHWQDDLFELGTQNAVYRSRSLSADIEADITIKEPKENIRVKKMRSVIGSLHDTNDTIGMNFERTMIDDGARIDTDFRGRLRDEWEFEGTWEEYRDGYQGGHKKFTEDFYAEINEIQNRPNKVESATKNPIMFKLAKIWYEEVPGKALIKLNAMGRRNLTFSKFGIKPQWSRVDVLKMTRDEFIEYLTKPYKVKGVDMAPRLKNRVKDPLRKVADEEGNLILTDEVWRENMAGRLYDEIDMRGRLTEGELKIYQVGKERRLAGEPERDPIAQAAIDLIQEHGGTGKSRGVSKFIDLKSEQLDFRDGPAMAEVNAKLGVNKTLDETMHNSMVDIAREITLVKFFGPNYQKGWIEYQKYIEVLLGKNHSTLGKGNRLKISGVIGDIENIVNPVYASLAEGYRPATGLSSFTNYLPTARTIRNLQMFGKLGTAIVTSVLDTINFRQFGRYIDLGFFDMVGAMFDVAPFRGKSRRSNVEYARQVLELSESMLDDAAASRFSLNDGGRFKTKWDRKAERGARFVMKASMLQQWTKNLKAAAAGLYGKKLGSLIDSGIEWKKIPDGVKETLSKYGFNEADWITLQKLHKATPDGLLDARGRVMLHKLPETLGDLYSSSIRTKISSTIGDVANTMIITPGRFDRVALGGFVKPGEGWSEFWKLVTQFKSYPETFQRKHLWRLKKAKWHKGKAEQAKYVFHVAQTAVYMTMMGALVIQAKQYIAGKQPYKNTSAFWLRAFEQSGSLGLISDMFMQLGGGSIVKEYTDEENVPDMTVGALWERLIGPTLADMSKFMIYGQGMVKGAVDSEDDDWAHFKKNANKVSQVLAGYVGFKNLIWTKMLWRKYVTEVLTEKLDPKGHRRLEKYFEKKARKELFKAHGGKDPYNNFFMENVLKDIQWLD